MLHSDFKIDKTFTCGGRQFKCTDIGTRVIVAIKLDVEKVSENVLTLIDAAQAEADGWHNGPPYAVAELVFDENDMPACEPV